MCWDCSMISRNCVNSRRKRIDLRCAVYASPRRSCVLPGPAAPPKNTSSAGLANACCCGPGKGTHGRRSSANSSASRARSFVGSASSSVNRRYNSGIGKERSEANQSLGTGQLHQFGSDGRQLRTAAVFEALRRVEFQQLAALVDAPLDALEILRVAVAQFRVFAGDGLALLGVFVELLLQPGRRPFLPLARASPGTPGDALEAVDAGQFFGLGRIDVHDRGSEPLLFERLNILGNALLRDAEPATDLPLAHAAQVHAGDAPAPLEDAQSLLGIPTRHRLRSL